MRRMQIRIVYVLDVSVYICKYAYYTYPDTEYVSGNPIYFALYLQDQCSF
jgi:hypothetical protein